MSALLWIPDSVWQPLLFGALLVGGYGLCLYLFVTLKCEIGALRRGRAEQLQRVEAMEAALEPIRAAVETLGADLRDVERQTGMLVAPAPTRSGLNLSKRTQVLRMHRSGQDSAGIAAALALPRAEVELLIKVHRIVVEQI